MVKDSFGFLPDEWVNDWVSSLLGQAKQILRFLNQAKQIRRKSLNFFRSLFKTIISTGAWLTLAVPGCLIQRFGF